MKKRNPRIDTEGLGKVLVKKLARASAMIVEGVPSVAAANEAGLAVSQVRKYCHDAMAVSQFLSPYRDKVRLIKEDAPALDDLEYMLQEIEEVRQREREWKAHWFDYGLQLVDPDFPKWCSWQIIRRRRKERQRLRARTAWRTRRFRQYPAGVRVSKCRKYFDHWSGGDDNLIRAYEGG